MNKNKLHKEINRILDPQTAVKGIKDFCDRNLNQVGKSLRVNDNKGEGVLFVGGRKLITTDNCQLPSALVNLKNLKNEVGLSYAIFNARQKPMGAYQIISWESPLVRHTSRVPGNLAVKCDLVAYDAKSKQLVAVEVKLDPENDDTNIQHGLLQSMAYAHLLQHSLKTDRSGLRHQVQRCLRKWCCEKQANLPEVRTVACALAAPKEYFRASLKTHGEKLWISKAIKTKDAHFSKFWVLEFDCIKSEGESRGSKCIPQTNCKVRLFSDVNELAKFCL